MSGLLLAGLVATQARALELPTLRQALERTLADHPLACTGLGVVVADAGTGRLLLSERAEVPMAPASVMKLATSAAALSALGPSFRFHTRLFATGACPLGALQGDLVLVGGADPSLAQADLRAFARALRARGLRSVEGDLVGDASLVTAPSWEPGWVVDDLKEAYAPPVSALVLDGNLVARPPRTPEPVLDPVLNALEGLRTALAEAGIALGGQVRQGTLPATSRLLADHASAPLIDLVARMNKASLNLSAEALFRFLGTRQAVRPGSADAGSAAVAEALARLGVASGDLRITDGSGLSRYDLLTPRAIARILMAMNRRPEAAAFRTGLPIAGVDGTLQRRFVTSPLHGRLFAKTGTMSGVSALAGYLEGAQGRRWVVVVVVNGFTGSVRPAEALEAALVERFASALGSRGGF